FRDVQAEPRALGLAAGRVPAQAYARVEDRLEALGRYARALVGDGEQSSPVVDSQRHVDLATRRVLDRIAEKIGQHLRHAVAVAHGGHRAGGYVNAKGVLLGRDPRQVDLLAHQLGEVAGAGLDAEAAE